MRRLLSILGRKPGSLQSGVETIRQHFDEQFYLQHYPEVEVSSLDPAEHYFTVGWRLGSDPCAWFSSQDYLEAHPDVAAANVNPFHHFLTYGLNEGRAVRSSRLLPDPIDLPEDKPLNGAGVVTAVDVRADPFRMPSDLVARQRAAFESSFDADFYRSKNPDLSPLSYDELINHFAEYGWRELRDPCWWFSTKYYLTRYPDIARGGVNPFFHFVANGMSEGRLPDYYHRERRRAAPRPTVAAIVPNYNHARFLEQRILSIVGQDWPPSEIIILDDVSTDDSRVVIERIAATLSIPVKLVFNEQNSGNVFRQWEKGIALAESDVLWICESDDFCETNFLSTLAPYFCDPSIMIAFGAIQFATSEGLPSPGLDDYRESAARGFWKDARVEGVATWFKGPFGLRNVIANVGGCLIRRQTVEQDVWDGAQSYRVCGDWFLYMHLARGGRIAFDPAAVAYFRQHAKNTSVSSFRNMSFYEEHFRVALEMQRLFGVTDENVFKFYRIVQNHYAYSFKDQNTSELDGVFSLNRLANQKRERFHILIVILVFSTGGGEIFPINLANALAARGYAVSLMPLMTTGENKGIRSRLDSRIAIYEPDLIKEIGFERFIETQQVDLVHTHYIAADIDFHRQIGDCRLPYVVTHHGSYEITDAESGTLMSIMAAVRHWVYLSEKNLERLDDLGLDRSKTTKLPNAVPLRQATFPYTRQSLGIESDAFVFGVASRAMRPKGWDIAAEALQKVRATIKQSVYVVFCGEGPDYKEVHDAYVGKPGVVFLGYQREIQAFYEMCDCALLPTRFAGESFPLTLIEAMIKHVPVLATDIGEIKNMITLDDATAGILIPNVATDEIFVDNLADAMKQIMVPYTHHRLKRGVKKVAERYDFDRLVSQYERVYEAAGLAKSSPRAQPRIDLAVAEIATTPQIIAG